ncbi:MAG TPA: hypothetical protein VM097_00555 [Mycobacteriales bacterium]|nr:hypothetical protein [Mycobacteriales bacterium]
MLRRAVALVALLGLAACSSSETDESADRGVPTPGAVTPTALTGGLPSSSPTGTVAPSASTAGSAPTTAATSAPSTTGGSTTGGSTGASAPRSTAAGTYTYDSSGSQTLYGAKQAVDSTSTLTMGKLADGQQSSTLHNSQGDTTQQLQVRTSGSYLASLTIDSPTLDTAFHFSPPVLLLPDPARVGATWSWHGTSDDGKTEVTATNKVLRTETVTVGGERVATVVLQSHLVITGANLSYTADTTNWVAPAYRLPVRTRTTGSGTYGSFPFSYDVTDVVRSVHPA